ncbi:DUF1499 domain-containing protein [Parvularcula lutaonensis]|uniref:DUF1499 domain-containing protein n=1 Tax=Parvularcula lutaonensis TaxID=491923 RepID=A0ABV7MDB7_9PROT|nr:DUF1499 domain-containing protein [Parvularcula lutaonensis]
MLDLQNVQKSPKPNQYLVAPEGWLANETPDAIAPVFTQGPDEVFAKLLQVIENTKGTSNVSASKEAGRIAYVAKVVIFKDDVDIAVLPHPEGSTLAIYSRSRVGYSDLGVNKKRVERLLADLKAAL